MLTLPQAQTLRVNKAILRKENSHEQNVFRFLELIMYGIMLRRCVLESCAPTKCLSVCMSVDLGNSVTDANIALLLT